jgi:hypothetical protein
VAAAAAGGAPRRLSNSAAPPHRNADRESRKRKHNRFIMIYIRMKMFALGGRDFNLLCIMPPVGKLVLFYGFAHLHHRHGQVPKI